MIDNSIFTQAKANFSARREEAALKIFDILLKVIEVNLSARSIRFTTKELCSIINFTLNNCELEALIKEHLPQDSGIKLFYCDDPDQTFEFSFSE